MAEANLREMIISYQLRKSDLTTEINQLTERKANSTAARNDQYQLLSAQKGELKSEYKEIYDDMSDTDQSVYKDFEEYLESTDFEDELEKITADYNNQIATLSSWETELDSQITTDSAELEEVNSYIDSWKQMLSSNIQEDYNFGLK